MQLGPDGLVRLTLDEVLSTPLIHLISGVDQEVRGKLPRCGTVTSVTGYTEWRSAAEPVIVVGWDWKSVCKQGRPQLSRVGPPRCNVMLVDHDQEDFDWDKQLEILGTVIDAMDWEHQTQATIRDRYR
jgi:hypothetical protein